MVDVGVALTWIAISAASAKGLSVFARAAVSGEDETGPWLTAEETTPVFDTLSPIDPPSRLLGSRS